ncbi:LysR family transcriptional regulator [Antarctobacter jejuensis]|uniref:LysR family transcriptional regulator n=1 Tax=Antarctobacter jejuensis TaxID=1439938 RepID=UPI003FD1650F
MNLRNVDLNLLPVLDALLIEHSTVRAAERLGLSQSAVSAALSRLRATFGDDLFVRQGQRIVPTSFALSLQAPLGELLQGAQQLLEGPARFDPARATNSFKLSGSDFYSEMLMPRLAQVFSREAPLMQIQQVDLVPDNYIGTLASEGIDLAIIPRGGFPEWVTSEPVHHSGFVLIARKGQGRLARAGVAAGEVVPLDLVADLTYVLFSPEGKLTGMGDAALARVGRSRRIAMTLPVMSGVLSAVATSDLCAFVPEQLALARAETLGLSLYHLPFHMPRVELHMAWHHRNNSSPAHQWLRAQVAAVLGEVDRMRFGAEDGTGKNVPN